MKCVKDYNFIVIQGWMRNSLQLKGNKLLIYSVIYGFSQDGKSWFQGSLEYLGEWAGASKESVCRLLKQMVNDGILEKKVIHRNGQNFPIYRATPIDKISTPLTNYQYPIDKLSIPPLTKCQYPIDKMSTNNIANNINKNIDESIDIYSEYLNYWNTQVAGGAVPKIRSLTKTRNTHLKNLLKTYSKDDIIEVFTKVRQSKFLSGRNGKWRATFDWTIKPSNFIKVLEGNFDDDTGGPSEMIDGLAAYMEGN
jgi:hypothetical protein